MCFWSGGLHRRFAHESARQPLCSIINTNLGAAGGNSSDVTEDPRQPTLSQGEGMLPQGSLTSPVARSSRGLGPPGPSEPTLMRSWIPPSPSPRPCPPTAPCGWEPAAPACGIPACFLTAFPADSGLPQPAPKLRKAIQSLYEVFALFLLLRLRTD